MGSAVPYLEKIRHPPFPAHDEAGFCYFRLCHGARHLAVYYVGNRKRHYHRHEPRTADVRQRPLRRLQSVLQLIFVPVNGFTNGVQPIISYNFGAGQFDRVRQTIRRMIAITFTATFVYVVFAMLRPALFAGLFTTDPELIAIVVKVLPVYIAGMAIFGLQSGVQSSFLGLGQAKISLFIALLRKVILLIPLALILPHFFGVMGVYYAEPIADVCSVVTAVTLFLCNIWKILSKETLAKVTHTEA